MKIYNDGGPSSHVTAATIEMVTPSAQPIKPCSLEQYAARLVTDMKSQPPTIIDAGTLYQLNGKKINGVACTFLLIYPDSHAVFGDLSTGVITTVDSNGKRYVALIGGSRQWKD